MHVFWESRTAEWAAGNPSMVSAEWTVAEALEVQAQDDRRGPWAVKTNDYLSIWKAAFWGTSIRALREEWHKKGCMCGLTGGMKN